MNIKDVGVAAIMGKMRENRRSRVTRREKAVRTVMESSVKGKRGKKKRLNRGGYEDCWCGRCGRSGRMEV